MMYFVSSSNGFEISIIRSGQPFESLMNEDIVYHEIGESIQGNACTYPQSWIECFTAPSQENKCHAWNSKNQKEEVIFFKEPFVFMGMMILVEIPQQSMHDVFVGKPGNAFHKNESCDDDKNAVSNHFSRFLNVLL